MVASVGTDTSGYFFGVFFVGLNLERVLAIAEVYFHNIMIIFADDVNRKDIFQIGFANISGCWFFCWFVNGEENVCGKGIVGYATISADTR